MLLVGRIQISQRNVMIDSLAIFTQPLNRQHLFLFCKDRPGGWRSRQVEAMYRITYEWCTASKTTPCHVDLQCDDGNYHSRYSLDQKQPLPASQTAISSQLQNTIGQHTSYTHIVTIQVSIMILQCSLTVRMRCYRGSPKQSNASSHFILFVK